MRNAIGCTAKFLAVLSGLLVAIGLVGRVATADADMILSYVWLASIALMLLFVYFLPALIAKKRDIAVGAGFVFFVNLLIGWTIVGWGICLLWAALGQSRQQVTYYAIRTTV